MPRQCILTAAERSALLAFPIEKSELIRLYTFSEQDLSVIKQRRGDANRLGFAVLLCVLRYPGQALSAGERPPSSFLTMVARQLGIDETIWDQYGEREKTRRELVQSVIEAQRLARVEGFDYLHRISEGYTQIRRYAPAFLDAFRFKAAPAAQPILDAIETLKRMDADGLRRVPADSPTDFVRKRWRALVFTDAGLDRRFYELCALAELKNALRSGDIWVQGSRQFKDFDEYLIPSERFSALREANRLSVAVATDCEAYLKDPLCRLEQQLETVDRIAQSGELPDVIITVSGLKITPLASAVPEEAEQLIRQAYAPLPRVKITELLLEVDDWTGFTRHFTHLKSQEVSKDRILLLTAILADAINLGLTKMAEACPGATYARLTWLQAWHIRDETYSAALAEVVNAQFRHPFAAFWGDGTTSSSDGQYFRAGGRGEAAGQINAHYGGDPGVLFYTHVSDQYAPFHTKVINAAVRDATHVLDGLLYHESDLRIEEHYTDTAGFTDHVFALMHLLGFRFAPTEFGVLQPLQGKERSFDATELAQGHCQPVLTWVGAQLAQHQ